MANAYAYLTKREKERLQAAVRRISSLEKSDDINVFGPQVLEIMQGIGGNVWTCIDEQPGMFGYFDDRFYMVRQVRNAPTWGRRLLTAVNSRAINGTLPGELKRKVK